MTARLFEMRLPAGDVSGIDIDYATSSGHTKLWSRDWLAHGYDGIRIIGAGRDATHMRPTWDDTTFRAVQHSGLVQMEELTIHCGAARGVFFGLQNTAKRPPDPKFQLLMLNGAKVIADPPRAGMNRSTKWGIFGYQSDVFLQDVELDCYFAAEHSSYWHGFSKRGLMWERVTMRASGAEGCKVRADSTETAPTPGAAITIIDSTFRNWYQTWSDRGGAGLVVQGGAADVSLDRCVFWGGGALPGVPSNARSHCVMISSEGLSYDTEGGTTGPGNGHVRLHACAMEGLSTVDWNNSILRVARNGGTQSAAKSVTVDSCGLWGALMLVQITDVPSGEVKILNCNTPALRNYCGHALGMNVNHEATFPTSVRKVPISEGIHR